MTTETSPAQRTRAEERHAFLQDAKWGDAKAAAIAGDASTRSYERLSLGERTAILMNAPLGAETAACVPEDDDASRRSKGYNAMARLAGPNLHAFLAIADLLKTAGLSAPAIYHADPQLGFALIEDLGDDLYARVILDGADERLLYECAIDALIQLHQTDLKPPHTDHYVMQSYDPLAMFAEVELLAEWYAPWRTKTAPPQDANQQVKDAWSAALTSLPAPSTIILRDYHAENLLWLPERSGAQRVGVIDFQDGLFGRPAYDLVSLLEDARRDVSPALAEAMVQRYCAAMAGEVNFDEAAFRESYALLGAQRNAKILGVFARLIVRDGKPRYEQFMARVEAHFANNLKHPALAGVADAVAALNIGFPR